MYFQYAIYLCAPLTMSACVLQFLMSHFKGFYQATNNFICYCNISTCLTDTISRLLQFSNHNPTGSNFRKLTRFDSLSELFEESMIARDEV